MISYISPKSFKVEVSKTYYRMFKKGYFDYDYHYSHFVLDFPNKITINEDDLKRYLRGETIPSNETRAYVQIYFKNIPISFGKGDGKVIKNHFPKGLRHIF